MKYFGLGVIILLACIMTEVNSESKQNAVEDDLLGNKILSMLKDYYTTEKMPKCVQFFICSSIKDIISLSKLFSLRGISITVKNLDSSSEHGLEEDVRNMLKPENGESSVVLDFNCPHSDLVLKQASAMEMFNASFKWLIVDSKECPFSKPCANDTEQDKASDDLVSISDVFSYLMTKNMSINADITVAAVKCSENVDVNKVEGTFDCFTENTTETLSRGMEHKTLGDITFVIYDVYNIHQRLGGKMNITEIGEWNQQTGFQIKLKYRPKRNDFHGLTMRAVTVMLSTPNRPVEEILRNPGYTMGVNGMTKYNSALMDLLQDLYNFRVTYIISNVWGGIKSDGTQDGMMGIFQRREAEVPATGMRYLPERLPHADFLMKTWEIDVSFFFRVPSDIETGGMSWGRFTEPFSWSSWVAAVSCSLLLAALLACSMGAHARAWREDKTESKLIYALFSVFAAICQQVFEAGPQPRKDIISITSNKKDLPKVVYIEPHYLSGRLVCLITFLLSLLIYNYYTSSVVSSLLSAPPASLGGLKDLIDGPLELVFEDIGYTRTLFENPNYSFTPTNKHLEKVMVEKKVKTSKRKKPIFVDPKEGVKLVRQGGFAYQTEPETGNPLIADTFDQDEICEVQAIPMMEAPIFLVLEKYSPFSELFMIGLIRIMESGQARRLEKIFKAPSLHCSGGTGRPRPVPIARVVPALLLLLWAVALSLAILLVEVLHHRIIHARN